MKNKGFTLIELLAVVLIIGILTAIAVPQYRKSLERSRVAEAYSMMPAIRESLLRWAKENNKNWGETDWFVDGHISTNLPQPSWRDEVSFNALDISMKGKQSDTNQHEWQTKNFTYRIFPDEIGLARDWWPINPTSVKATFRRGRYAGSVVYLMSGTAFLCGSAHSDNPNDETSSEICDVLGLKMRVMLDNINAVHNDIANATK